jgi:hypothetical protein
VYSLGGEIRNVFRIFITPLGIRPSVRPRDNKMILGKPDCEDERWMEMIQDHV